jgi:hypothetical protein
MGNNKSRRDFLSMFIQKDKNAPENQKIKMLTADGKLVEVDKAIFEKASKKQKASNKDIYNWMENPSKEKS